MKFAIPDFKPENYEFVDANVIRNKVIQNILYSLKNDILSKADDEENELIYRIPSGYKEEILAILEANNFKFEKEEDSKYKIIW